MDNNEAAIMLVERFLAWTKGAVSMTLSPEARAKALELANTLRAHSLESVREEARHAALEEAAKACQEISAHLHDETLHADQEEYASLHRKRNGVVVCIAAIRALQHAPARVAEGGSICERCGIAFAYGKPQTTSDGRYYCGNCGKDVKQLVPESPAEEQPGEGEHLNEKIRHAINSVSAETASNTPDYILAQYLVACLGAFNTATQHREAPAKEQCPRCGERLNAVGYCPIVGCPLLPAKGRLGEQNAAPQAPATDGGRVDAFSPGPVAAAPDVAAMVRYQYKAGEGIEYQYEPGRGMARIEKGAWVRYDQAAALIEKLGQQYNDLLTATGGMPPPPERPWLDILR